ncbi:UNVERIFIED_CONTAM: hypothetical protein GTU68_040600 [Idotea baltica]|nr:hypothetical protein [Idotea baltica]
MPDQRTMAFSVRRTGAAPERPVDGGVYRRHRARRGGGYRRGCCRSGGGAGRRLGPGECRGARPGSLPPAAACSGKGRSPGPDRGDRCGQAAETGPGRRGGVGALSGILRRGRRQAARSDDPLSGRLHGLHPARTSWGHRAHRALELSHADHRPFGRRGAGNRQCLCPETGGRRLPDRARLCRSRPSGRSAGRRAQRGAGSRLGSRRGTDRASARSSHQLHRIGRHRGACADGGGAKRRACDPGARRQVAPTRV